MLTNEIRETVADFRWSGNFQDSVAEIARPSDRTAEGCYVLIDLKRGELNHQDLGQMQMYVNYFDRYVKTEDELPTVGIVLCGRKNDTVVELTLLEEANIYASKYQLYLPSKQELAEQLESVWQEIEASKGGNDE